MDWADGDGSGADAPGAAGEFRPGRRALDDRLETWVSRGRELVDGVSGTRPGTRPPGRGGGGRLDGLGRWVEGKLDWLLDDRDDWREPWQEAERPAPPRAGGGGGEWSSPVRGGGGDWGETGERRESGESGSAPVRRSRAPLEAISRRGAPPADLSRQTPTRRQPPPPEAVLSLAPNPLSSPSPLPSQAPSQEWPEEEAFMVPRWRRQEPPPPPPVDPLAAAPAPTPLPGRPLPRSTRRR